MIFSRPLFIVIFRPDMLKFHPYSILTRDTMVGFVIYCVLSVETKFGENNKNTKRLPKNRILAL